MTDTILDRRPTTSRYLVDIWSLVAYGSADPVNRRFGVTPRMQDRLAAAAELADRLHCRAVQAIDVDEGRPDVPVYILPPGTRVATK